ncbi:hypothetical protein DM480_12120 [Sphingomonas sp. FARSPH]|nr:hypothetical protein DM480_12120 [Sphingomonas sp. FARSPH]
METAWPTAILRRLRPLRRPVAAETDLLPVDAPIENAAQDLLRRSPLVARVAELLGRRNFPAGRVIAIRGDWGSGKSPFKNLVAERLSSRLCGRVICGCPSSARALPPPERYGPDVRLARADDRGTGPGAWRPGPLAMGQERLIDFDTPRHQGDLVGRGGAVGEDDDRQDDQRAMRQPFDVLAAVAVQCHVRRHAPSPVKALTRSQAARTLARLVSVASQHSTSSLKCAAY